MKKIAFLLLLMIVSGSLIAHPRDYYNPKFDEDEKWQEGFEELPPFPNFNDNYWHEFHLDNDTDSSLWLLLSSVHKAEDNSIRYVLNIRSKNGFDNLSAEGIYCKDKTYRAFAFGDVVNKRWIKSQNITWNPIGSSMYRQNKIRYALKNVFCNGYFTQDYKELKKRLQTAWE